MIGRTNAGGGGVLRDTDAVLRVIAPENSTVTITKGGTTKTAIGHTNAIEPSVSDYYFFIHQSQFDSSAWTVTATNGVYSASDTIVINSSDAYVMTLQYRLVLYAAGDQSGWTAMGWRYSTGAGITAAAPSIAYGGDSMVITQSSSHSGIAYHAKADFTRYDSLVLTGSFSGPVTSGSGLFVLSSVDGSGTYPSVAVASKAITATGTQNITIDISALTGEYFAAIGTARNSNGAAVFTITGVWLE